LRVKQALYRLS